MQSGTVLADKYRLESLLGRGGMGSVWRAEHLGLRAPVAVKLMDPAIAESPDAVGRFHREAHAAASIRSPHVVQVLDHGIDAASQRAFIVMELLEGETLGQRLARQSRLAPRETAGILSDVCRALSRAHQAAIIHRDLKPDNIFLVRDEREFAKVLDFGVAKADPYALGGSESTRTGALMGTPYYMSPEQISGAKNIDARSDLWAVAVIACECVTGCRPYRADTVGGMALAICSRPAPRASSLGPASPAFDAWLARALDRDPARRFQTASELAAALDEALAEAAKPATRPQTFSSPRRDTLPGPLSTTAGASTAVPAARAAPRWLWGSTLAVLGLIAGGAWFALEHRTEGTSEASSAASAVPSSPVITSTPALTPVESKPIETEAPLPSPRAEPEPGATLPEPAKAAVPRVFPVKAQQAEAKPVENPPPAELEAPENGDNREMQPRESERAVRGTTAPPSRAVPAPPEEPLKKKSRREQLVEVLGGER